MARTKQAARKMKNIDNESANQQTNEPKTTRQRNITQSSSSSSDTNDTTIPVNYEVVVNKVEAEHAFNQITKSIDVSFSNHTY